MNDKTDNKGKVIDIFSKAKAASKGGLSEETKQEYQEDVIELLESFLEMAKNGDIKQVLLVGSNDKGLISRSMAGLPYYPSDTAEMLNILLDQYRLTFVYPSLFGEPTT